MHGAPAYIAEMAPPSYRGLLVSLKEGFIVLGMLLGYTAGLAFNERTQGWRCVYAIAVPIAACMIAGVFLLPHCRTLGQRKAFEIVLGMMKPESGLFMAGHDSVFDAARADLFGRRPELGAQIQAKHALWATAAHGAPPPLSAYSLSL